ncbi:hypothetical protein [Pseudomonas sp. S1(2024)]|uniref:hypothetical protein n=1 Tax=Pseudomonas sp. S1(2024) TaxID=3390191 RepID=UPI00397C34D8
MLAMMALTIFGNVMDFEMPLSHAQFYALPVGAEIDAMKKRFVVDRRETVGGVEQPVLVEADTQAPLFGAIYITHLMSITKGVNQPMELPATEAMAAPPAVEHAVAVAAEAFDPLKDVDTYDAIDHVAVQPELSLAPEILHPGRRAYPAPDQYTLDLEAD